MGNNTGQRVVVIGGGIAGASAAFALADHPSKPTVVLAEAEAQLAHHTTGRSAAQLILNYGADPVRPLTSASLGFLNDPPADYCDGPLLTPQSVITVGTNDQDEVLDAALASGAAVNPEVREIPIDEAAERFPPLRPDRFDRAILEDGSFDIDVAGLHQCFVRGFRDRGGRIAVLTRIDAAAPRSGGGWTLSTTDGPLVADLVVNAAGAWGDVVAAAAGVAPVGLVPKRRTAFMVASRWPESPSWPMLADAELAFYLKPDGPQFLCSPGDETPSEPVDARAEELDVAMAIDRINDATTLEIRSVRSRWAGLRSFVGDGSMVIGPDPERPDFVWCVGQGGTGIQTSPAAGRLVADLAIDGRPGSTFDDVPLDLGGLTPDRIRAAGP